MCIRDRALPRRWPSRPFPPMPPGLTPVGADVPVGGGPDTAAASERPPRGRSGRHRCLHASSA
eukprot:1289102-Alexandrium_andersonii.AAC.1